MREEFLAQDFVPPEHVVAQLSSLAGKSTNDADTRERFSDTAIDALEPITVSSVVVSVTSREITSPVRIDSKNAGGSFNR